MDFVSSKQNGQNLVHDGYVYNFHKANKDGSKDTYLCQNRNSKRCPASDFVEGDTVVVRFIKNVEEQHLEQLYVHGKNLRLFFALCFVSAEHVREAYEMLADALVEEV